MNFLEQANDLDHGGRRNEAMDLIYDQVDDLMWQDRLDLLDGLFQSPAIDFTTDVLLSLLTASLPIKSQLPSRSRFLADVELVLKQRDVFNDRILVGL